MAYFKADFQTLTNGAVTATETVYFNYDGASLTCSQAEASVTVGLTEAQIVALRALCNTYAPTAPQGYKAQVRDCSAFDVIVIADNNGL